MITVTPSAQFRDAAGRFAHFDGSDVLAARLLQLGTETVAQLRGATPVRTGRAQAGWQSSYFPSQKAVRITNEAPYAFYLITGTRYMEPNPNLRAVVEALPAAAQVALQDMGRSYINLLMGA